MWTIDSNTSVQVLVPVTYWDQSRRTILCRNKLQTQVSLLSTDMMDIVIDLYHKILSKADNRVADWPLMSSPVPTVAAVTLYLFVVCQGQKWMKAFHPFDLKSTIVVYNFFLVVLSIYMLFEFILSSWTAPGFSLSCQAMDYSDNPYSVRLASACWWFYFSKIIELMDTVFFVLRKKNSQITFLHVYHHSTMPLLWWMAVKFVGGGEGFIFSATLNSGVHALMYLYYMLSAMGPAMQPYLWWKQYLTSLQLIQFWLVLLKTMYLVYVNCGYPVEHGYVLIAYMVSHIVLFSNFYYKTYHRQDWYQKEDKKKNYVEDFPAEAHSYCAVVNGTVRKFI